MSHLLSGASRIHFIVGDPIAQVKSPAGVTQAFADHGHNAICVPAHVAPAHLAEWLRGASLAQNVDGIIVTVPHKFACTDLCGTTSERAAFLHTVNTMRRNADGSWHGDMFDGLGFVTAMQDKGCQPAGKKALLVGAGGAGSAIAHALVMVGVSELAIFDPDEQRRTGLVDRLAGLHKCPVTHGSADPSGFDLVLNATPVGMKAGDPYPLDVTQLQPQMFCGCVITAPAVTPFIAAARAKGCATMTGADMFACVRDLMVDFLLGK
ncbi:MAG: shikimate dehydrogenase [Hydrogenophaga sp.]|uniref:shikimate dehydrogenase family protein n=1 Tax=Hydrogenophaga sp. TaxID=1904254 RepID=UPI0027188991|nr:shikimate dehydrogenase [Hydrogenophaga sp.]MDO9146814.1 shikimate dehydrogenase [Hydrogenophaga sp.]MDO9605749.1 shikimate dehydrogenase [Hydrogenophaga sp.]